MKTEKESGYKLDLFNPEGGGSFGEIASVASGFIGTKSKGGNIAKNALSFSAQGAQIGGPWGAAAGAALGVGVGLLQNKKIAKDAEKQRNTDMMANQQSMYSMSRSTYGAMSSFKNSLYARNGGMLFKKGGAIILGGHSHDDGGNDIVDASTGKKIGETESEELLLNSYQTERLESMISKYEKSKNNNDLEDIGRWFKNVIENETSDSSGKFEKLSA